MALPRHRLIKGREVPIGRRTVRETSEPKRKIRISYGVEPEVGNLVVSGRFGSVQIAGRLQAIVTKRGEQFGVVRREFFSNVHGDLDVGASSSVFEKAKFTTNIEIPLELLHRAKFVQE